jgi:hypothetical protein
MLIHLSLNVPSGTSGSSKHEAVQENLALLNAYVGGSAGGKLLRFSRLGERANMCGSVITVFGRVFGAIYHNIILLYNMEY